MRNNINAEDRATNKPLKRPLKGGRPKTDAGLGLEYRIYARLNLIEKDIFENRVKESGLNKSDFIREAVLNSEIKAKVGESFINMERQLVGIATNINQIARQANCSGYRPNQIMLDAYRELLALVKRMRRLSYKG